MEIHGLPPASRGGAESPLGPSDKQLIAKYKGFVTEFFCAWKNGNEADVVKAMKNLSQFLLGHKLEIERLCNTNGWSFAGSVGYVQNIEGSLGNISYILSHKPSLNSPQYQMLSESLSSVRSMMTTTSM